MLINLKNDKKKAMMIWKNVFAKIDNEDMAKNRHISYEKNVIWSYYYIQYIEKHWYNIQFTM